MSTIPARYVEPQKFKGDSKYTKLLVRGSYIGEFNPSEGQNRITFDLPNIPSHFLQCSEVFLEGEIKATATNSGGQAHTVIRPRVDDCQVIIDRFDFESGGQLIEQSLNNNLAVIHKCVQGSGQRFDTVSFPVQDEDLQYIPYSQAHYVNPAAYQKFKIRLQTKPTELFGPSTVGDTRTQVMLPTFLMPKTQIVIYFRRPQYVVTCDPTATSAGLATSYTLTNMRLSCSYIQSPTLLASIRQRGGFTTTFEGHAYQQMTVGALTGGTKYSMQLPSSYASVNHVLGRVIRSDHVSDPQLIDRLKLSSSTEITSANVRLNGKNRYIEDLDKYGVLQEMNLIYPKSIASNYIMNPNMNSTHQIWALLCGSDHYDGKAVSGFKSSVSVGGITPEFSFVGNLAAAAVMEVWISHMRTFSCTLAGQCQVRY